MIFRIAVTVIVIIFFGNVYTNAQLFYRHKSARELQAMSPAQRVEEWVKEDKNHKFILGDFHDDLLYDLILRDGQKSLPRIIELIDQYQPARSHRKSENFDACLQLLTFIDSSSVRLRSSSVGRQAMTSFENAIDRMKTTKLKAQTSKNEAAADRLEQALLQLPRLKGLNDADTAISNSLRLSYKITLSKEELLRFIEYLIKMSPDYPSWSGREGVSDESELNAVGHPVKINIMREPAKYYTAYLDFRRAGNEN